MDAEVLSKTANKFSNLQVSPDWPHITVLGITKEYQYVGHKESEGHNIIELSIGNATIVVRLW